MAIIPKIKLSALRIAEYTQLLDDTEALCKVSAGNPPTEIASFVTALHDANAQIKAIFKTDPQSAYTAQVSAADAARDRDFSGLYAVARAYAAFHYDADTRAAAEKLARAFSIYGEVPDQAYQAETASIAGLVQDLSTKQELKDAVALLGLSDWVAQLGEANSSFNELYLQRTGEYAATATDKSTTELRPAADAAFRKLAEKVEAYNSINDGAAPWGGIVSSLKSLVEQYNATLASRAGRRAAEEEGPVQGSEGQ